MFSQIIWIIQTFTLNKFFFLIIFFGINQAVKCLC